MFRWNQSKEESENWPVMEGALFIYPHKRAHLYFRPDNFIVLSASTKMVKKKVFSCSTRSNQKRVCLLIKRARLQRRCLECFYPVAPCTSPVSHLLAFVACTEDWRENANQPRSSACKPWRRTRFSKVN